MKLKKKYKTLLIIVSVLILSILAFISYNTIKSTQTTLNNTLTITKYDSLQISEVYSVNKPNFLNNFLTIVTNKENYIRGERARIQDYQYIWEFCSTLKSKIKLSKFTISDFTEVFSKEFTFSSTSPTTIFYTIDLDTTPYEQGEYEIESRWYCDGKELGSDGKLLDGNI
ncbi:MAG: hypothetical protein AABY22_15490, partial [Nanoarchaeota archaeon]